MSLAGKVALVTGGSQGDHQTSTSILGISGIV